MHSTDNKPAKTFVYDTNPMRNEQYRDNTQTGDATKCSWRSEEEQRTSYAIIKR